MTLAAQAKSSDDERRIVVEFAGDIPILLPMPSDYLPERHLDALRKIEAEYARGRRTYAQRLALDLEKRLGITMADRLTALAAHAPEDADLEAAIAHAAATAVIPPPVSRKRRAKSVFSAIVIDIPPDESTIELPEGERGRSKEDLRRWERSRQMLVSQGGRISDDQKEAHAAIMADVETQPHRRREDQDLARHLSARADSAISQGQQVEVSKTGRVNVVSWDAVKSLGQAKALSAEELDTAVEFKALYECRAVDAGAMDYGAIRGAGHDHEAFVAKRAERAFACKKIGDAERAIALRCQPPSLTMFRAVLDENKTITSFGKGRAYERNLDALKRALAVAREKLKEKM